LVDDFQFDSALAGFFRGAEASDGLHQARLAQSERKRAAHQAAADQGKPLECHSETG